MPPASVYDKWAPSVLPFLYQASYLFQEAFLHLTVLPLMTCCCQWYKNDWSDTPGPLTLPWQSPIVPLKLPALLCFPLLRLVSRLHLPHFHLPPVLQESFHTFPYLPHLSQPEMFLPHTFQAVSVPWHFSQASDRGNIPCHRKILLKRPEDKSFPPALIKNCLIPCGFPAWSNLSFYSYRARYTQ